MKQHATFRKIISILVIISLVGCTSLKPIEVPPDTLHERIRHEGIVKVGDRVRIVTEDEKEHRFVVTGVNADEIRGEVVKIPIDADEIREEVVTIPIDSVVAVETQEFSIGKTTLLAGGVTATMLLIFIAIAPAAILAASAP